MHFDKSLIKMIYFSLWLLVCVLCSGQAPEREKKAALVPDPGLCGSVWSFPDSGLFYIKANPNFPDLLVLKFFSGFKLYAYRYY